MLRLMADGRIREWTKYLPDGFVIQVYMKTVRGRVVSFSAVLIKDGQCITRYDTAHGFPHRDVIGKKGATIHKEKCTILTLEEVFRYADEDLSQNYAKYHAYYEEN